MLVVLLWLFSFILIFAAIPFIGGLIGAAIGTGGAPDGIAAVLVGGTTPAAIWAAAGSAVALGVTLRFTAGVVLDRLLGASPFDRFVPFVATGEVGIGALATMNRDLDTDAKGLGLGQAVNWVGAAIGGILIAGMAIASWPVADANAVAQVVAGTADTSTWIRAAVPELGRATIASIAGVLVGAFWSVEGAEREPEQAAGG